MEQCIVWIKYIINKVWIQFTWHHITEIVIRGFAVFGGIKAFFEFSDYFFKDTEIGSQINDLKICFSSHILIFTIGLTVALFLLHRRKTSFSWRINGSNLAVEISLCDLFIQEGLKVIHVTDTFDTDYTIPSLIDCKTLHGQFLMRYRKEITEINHQIKDALKGCTCIKNNKLAGKKQVYPIGTVAMINISKGSYALAAYSEMQPNKRAIMPQSKEKYNDFLVQMWMNLSQQATTDETVNITVFGEGLNRMPALFTKQKKISEIIRSFIACSLEGVSYKKLRICLKYNKKENLEEFEKLHYLQYEFDSIDVQKNEIPIGSAMG